MEMPYMFRLYRLRKQLRQWRTLSGIGTEPIFIDKICVELPT